MASTPSKKNCPHCGGELLSGARFCHQCGRALDEGDAAEGQLEGQSADDSPARRLSSLRGAGIADNESEAVLWEGRYSTRGLIHGWLFGGVVTVAAIVLAVLALVTGIGLVVAAGVVGAVWLWLLILLAYRKMSCRYQLTDQRLIHHRGVLQRVSNRIEVIDIDDVTYAQTILERMVGVGRITIISSDRSDPEFRLIGIDQVERVATLIDDARRRERMRRGLYVESV